MKRTTLVLPDDLAELIEHEARRQRVSVSELIRRCLRQALMGTEASPRSIPFAAIIDDPEMVHGDRAEEELAKSWGHEPDRDR